MRAVQPQRQVSDTLARLRVCQRAALTVPDDLLVDAIACLESVTDAHALRARRDMLIRRAALLLPDATPYARAGALASEAKALVRRRRSPPAGDTTNATQTPCELLRQAAAFGGLPESQRQFYRVLTKAGD